MATKTVLDFGGDAVTWILGTPDRVPEMMGNELEQQALGCWPGQGVAGGEQTPALEIGKVRRQLWLLLPDFN